MSSRKTSAFKISALNGALLCLLSACGAMTMAEDTPATITNATAETRTTLQRAVSGQLKRESVILADDALVSDSLLIVEPARLRDPQGNLLQGRETRAPERFRLVKNRQACVLIHENTGVRATLAGVRCSEKK